LDASLSDDEKERALRFHFDVHRNRFITGRGFLRRVLAEYLAVDPGQLRFAYADRGKPALIEPTRGRCLGFNLSHSAGIALLAVGRDRMIGVDVERLRAVPDAEQLAERFFSARERAAFRAIDRDERNLAFFRCWTRKEAFIKAVGDGLSYPLQEFDVTLAPDQAVQLLSIRGASSAARNWTLRELLPAPGYVAALAVEGRPFAVECWCRSANR
jgi:4'-phosphopantetheinyl transferase